EGDAASLELPPEILEVVDLTVVRNDDRAVVDAHRLMPERREVQDREARVSQRDREVLCADAYARRPRAEVIGTTMCQSAGHAVHVFDARMVDRAEHSADAAHATASSRRALLRCGAPVLPRSPRDPRDSSGR